MAKPYYEHFGTKLSVDYLAEFLVDLHKPGAVKQISTSINSLSIKRMPWTTKSRITFSTANNNEGFLSVYLYILNKKQVYVFVTGIVHGISICVQGPLLELSSADMSIKINEIFKYLKGKVKVWSRLYESHATAVLIDSLNKITMEQQNVLLQV